MQPAADKMKTVLAAIPFADSPVPVCANVTNAFVTHAQEFAPLLVRQVTAPVRWDTGCQAMIKAGADRFVEVGHGKVLAGLMKRIDKAVPILGVQDEESLKTVLAEVGA